MKKLIYVVLLFCFIHFSCKEENEKGSLLACSGNCLEISGNIFNKSLGQIVTDKREIKIYVRTADGLLDGYFEHIGTIAADQNGNFTVKINREEMKNYPIKDLHFRFVLTAKPGEFGPFEPQEYTLNSGSLNFNLNYVIYIKSNLLVQSHNSSVSDTIFHYGINLNCDSIYNETGLIKVMRMILPGQTVVDTISTGLDVNSIVEFTYTKSKLPNSDYVRNYKNIRCESIVHNTINFDIP